MQIASRSLILLMYASLNILNTNLLIYYCIATVITAAHFCFLFTSSIIHPSIMNINDMTQIKCLDLGKERKEIPCLGNKESTMLPKTTGTSHIAAGKLVPHCAELERKAEHFITVLFVLCLSRLVGSEVEVIGDTIITPHPAICHHVD